MNHLYYLFSICLIFLTGIIFYRRKQRKPLKPMGHHIGFIPPNYRCLSATPIDPGKISERIKAYTVGTPAKDIHEFHSNLLTQLHKITA